MKLTFFRIAALLTGAASAVSFAAAMPASAAETAKPKDTAVETVCPGYVPLSADMLYITPDAAVPVAVELFQHSPERANLLLYSTNLTGDAAGSRYSFAVEPGNYTLRVVYSPVYSSKSNKVVIEHDLSFENADYSVAPNAFEKTEFDLKLAGAVCKDTSRPFPADSNATKTVKDGVQHETLNIRLDYYDGERGDFDGNGRTEVSDAQLVLKEYVENISGKTRTDAANAKQSAICDIDGDGKLSASDAQYILQFYTMTVAGKTPTWPDGAPDRRYPAKS